MPPSSTARLETSDISSIKKNPKLAKKSEFLKKNRVGKVSVIITTYNEKGNVRPVVETLEPYIKPYCKGYEIIFVDDSSPDRTAEEIRRLAKENANIRLIVRENMDGLGGAQKAGLDAATGDVLIILDGDCSQDPRTCVDFLYSLSQGNDMVIGSRFVKGGRIIGQPLLKRYAGRIANIIIARRLLGNYLHDFTHSYRAMKRTAYNKVESHLKAKHHPGFCLELSVLMQRAGLKVAEVPTLWIERSVGSSKLRIGSTTLRFIKELFILGREF